MTFAVIQPQPAAHLWERAPVHDAVALMLGERPASVTLERTHFPGERPVQLVFSAMMTDGRRKTVLAEICPEDPQGRAERLRATLSKSRHGQAAGMDSAAILAVREAGLVLRRPGLDERLPGLRLLHDAAFARAGMTQILGRDAGPVDTRLVAHRLGKRAVLRIRGLGFEVYARLRPIKSGDGDSRLARHRALWCSLPAQGGLRIPKPLGALPLIGASVFGVLPGLEPDFSGPDVEAVTRAIAALQALDPAGLPVHTGADEARILAQWLARCEAGRPGLARRIAPALTHRMAELEQAAAPPRPCHRDLHEQQILVSGGVAGLLDFDTLCLSDPALDPGNLLAHLFLAGQDEEPLRARLDRPGLGLWRSAALFRLAMIYAFTSRPDAVLDRLVEEASADAVH